MEAWRIFLSVGIVIPAIGMFVLAFMAYKGKCTVPPSKIMLTGTKEEKAEYIQKASRNIAFKYLCYGLLCCGLTGVTLFGSPWMILGSCGVICGLMWVVNKVKS